MANELISKDFSKYKIADVFKGQVPENDLAAGIQGGFAVVGFKGKTWSYRVRGEEVVLMREDGDGPRSSIDVVILRSARNKSKTWYGKGYIEGSSAPPDCFSNNGETPDPTSPNLQSPTCATCPRNVWGSRVTENNKRAKECTDSKRLAIVPLEDIVNEKFGGPMLLRVPAASLADLATYGNEMSKLGFPYYSLATKITFDPQEAYPKFKFQAIRPLNKDEATEVVEQQANPLIDRILNEIGELVTEGTARPQAVTPKVITADVVAPAAKQSKVTPRKTKPAPQVEEIEDAEVVEETAAAAPEEAPEEEAEEDDGEAFDKALDAKLSAFLGGKKKS